MTAVEEQRYLSHIFKTKKEITLSNEKARACSLPDNGD